MTPDTKPVVRIDLADRTGRAYDVNIGRGTLGEALSHAAKEDTPGATQAFIVADTGVPDAMVRDAVEALVSAGLAPTVHAVTPTERVKSLDTLRAVLMEMSRARIERKDAVVALGGGIVGDVAGFAASVYRRGCPVIQCPTTLLAMVDASVGGKTGVNLELPGGDDAGGAEGGATLLKNAVGAFHQPVRVIADTDALVSLDPRELRCGLAECLKHGMIAADWDDPDLLAWTTHHLDRIRSLDHNVLIELVKRNVSVKARVVAADETESTATGGRALLNLGHTFAHAIETIPHLSPDGDDRHAPLKHGEAVSLGLVAAAASAEAESASGSAPVETKSAGVLAATRSAVAAAGLPAEVRQLPPANALIEAMSHDKKASGGQLRVVLPSNSCTARTVDNPMHSVLEAGWNAIRGA